MLTLFDNWLTQAIGIGTFLVVSIYLYYTRNYNYWKSRGIQQIDPQFPCGSFKDVLLQRVAIGEFLADLYRKTKGPLSGIYAFRMPCLLLKDPEVIKAVLMTDFSSFSERGNALNLKTDPAGGYNLFMLRNPEWKTLRQKLTPVFTSGKMKAMFELMTEIGGELKTHLDERINKPIQSKYVGVKYTIDVITSCAFGVKSYCLLNDDDPFFAAGKKMLTFTIERAINMASFFFMPDKLVQLLRLKFIHPETVTFLSKMWDQNLEHREKNHVIRNDLVTTLIQLKKNDPTMDNNKLLAQSVIFYGAGFESSSSVISFTLHHLAYRPDFQHKLREEIDCVVARHGGQITYDSINEMSYLDMVVSETLRMYPPLPFLTRVCTRTYTFPGSGFHIQPGTKVFIPITGLHKDPKYFSNPEEYDPDRFSKENKPKIPSGVYMPFGLGPHNCIGERFGLISSKYGIAKIIKNYKVLKVKDSPLKIEMDQKSFLTTSVNGLPLIFIPRSSTGA